MPDQPRLPPLDRSALLLDLDGTLLDIAPTPEQVVVEPGLLAALRALHRRLGGALGIISGRPLAQLDALLGDIPTAVAGEHGGVIRHHPGSAEIRPDLPAAPPAWLAAAAHAAQTHPGVRLEEKARGFVLHYRAAPASGPALHAALAVLVANDADHFALLAAHMAWEIRPRGADKGSALRNILAQPPFAGRLPIFIGDDVTDQDAIDAAIAAGGAGLMVPDVFGSAGAVRAWLAHAATVTPPEWPVFA